MQKKWLYSVGGAILILAFVIGIYQSDVAKKKPSLTSDDVHSIVLEQYPGDIKDVTLMRKNKHAIYTVDLQFEGKDFNVQVDGHSGEIVHVKQLQSSHVASDDQHKETLQKEEKETNENNANDESNQASQDKPVNEGNQAKDSQDKDNQAKEDSKKDDEKASQKKEDKQNEKEKDKQEKKKESNTSNSVLTAKDALEIAQKEFSGTVIEIERDKNNGRIVYEVEVVSETEKSEMEIDAMSGKVISIKIKQSNDKGKYTNVSLSMADALEIALLQYNGVVLEGELDTNNGGYVYEFEIERNGIEAEIEIDGTTGKILEYDVD